MEEGREAVAELDDADRGDDGDEAGKVGDGGADDEGDGPVDGDDAHPKELAFAVGERRGTEEFDGYVVVENWWWKSVNMAPAVKDDGSERAYP